MNGQMKIGERENLEKTALMLARFLFFHLGKIAT